MIAPRATQHQVPRGFPRLCSLFSLPSGTNTAARLRARLFSAPRTLVWDVPDLACAGIMAPFLCEHAVRGGGDGDGRLQTRSMRWKVSVHVRGLLPSFFSCLCASACHGAGFARDLSVNRKKRSLRFLELFGPWTKRMLRVRPNSRRLTFQYLKFTSQVFSMSNRCSLYSKSHSLFVARLLFTVFC